MSLSEGSTGAALRFPAPAGPGYREIATPRNSPLEEMAFGLLRLGPGEMAERAEQGEETVLVVLGGRCVAVVEGMRAWDVGERPDPFSGLPWAVYVPPGVPYRLATEGGAEVAVCRAPAERGGEAFVVRPEEVRGRTVGRDTWRREVRDIVGEDRPVRRLVVGETLNDPGAWSSYPPHKHDVHDPPHEVRLQEIYHYRLDPPGGFGLQRIYSPERHFDQALTVQHGDTVVIPFGYHPVVAGGGYRLYYLWMLAGEGRMLCPQEDPAYRVG